MIAAFLRRNCSGVTRGAGSFPSAGAAEKLSATSPGLGAVSPVGSLNCAEASRANAKTAVASMSTARSTGITKVGRFTASVETGIQAAFGHFRRPQERPRLVLRFLPFGGGLRVGDDPAARLHVE